mgnify:CR=1 FL=1
MSAGANSCYSVVAAQSPCESVCCCDRVSIKLRAWNSVCFQAAARALVVAREKASNEAKSEFMSLMCHEVRTPLNGCLASAEMLLETDLTVCPVWRSCEQ